jgi:hypothetical protein
MGLEFQLSSIVRQMKRIVAGFHTEPAALKVYVGMLDISDQTFSYIDFLGNHITLPTKVYMPNITSTTSTRTLSSSNNTILLNEYTHDTHTNTTTANGIVHASTIDILTPFPHMHDLHLDSKLMVTYTNAEGSDVQATAKSLATAFVQDNVAFIIDTVQKVGSETKTDEL